MGLDKMTQCNYLHVLLHLINRLDPFFFKLVFKLISKQKQPVEIICYSKELFFLLQDRLEMDVAFGVCKVTEVENNIRNTVGLER